MTENDYMLAVPCLPFIETALTQGCNVTGQMQVVDRDCVERCMMMQLVVCWYYFRLSPFSFTKHIS